MQRFDDLISHSKACNVCKSEARGAVEGTAWALDQTTKELKMTVDLGLACVADF